MPDGNRHTDSLVAEIQTDVKWIRLKLEEFPKVYVTLDRYKPVEKVVYAVVSLMLLSIVGALLALVF